MLHLAAVSTHFSNKASGIYQPKSSIILLRTVTGLLLFGPEVYQYVY